MSSPRIEAFFGKHGDAWRLYVWPNRTPCRIPNLDAQNEAYPVRLNLEDLEQHMWACDAPYEKRVMKNGDVELAASGRSAVVLSVWLEGVAEGGLLPAADAIVI